MTAARSPRRMLVLGHGYTAGWLTALLGAQGWSVHGTTRTRADQVRDAGASPLSWPAQIDAVAALARSADAILISAAPDTAGDPMLPVLGDAIAQGRAGWIGYLSTTGVYGDRQGGWVDEDSPLAPATARGQARVQAESDWQALARAHDLPLHIFRLAGIYGPWRGPFAKLRNGTARRIIKPGQVFSRIHVADLVQALWASICQPRPGAIYNLCDDDPAPPEDIIACAARMIGLPVPPPEDFATADMTPMARSFYAESKRVRNDRLKRELGVVLKYPDYRSGLQAMLKAETSAGESANPAG